MESVSIFMDFNPKYSNDITTVVFLACCVLESVHYPSNAHRTDVVR